MSFWNNKIKAAVLFTAIVCALYGTRALYPKRGAGIDAPAPYRPDGGGWGSGGLSRYAESPSPSPRRTTTSGGGVF